MLGWLLRSIILAVNFLVLESLCLGAGTTLLFRQGLPGQSPELPRPLALTYMNFTASPLLLKSSTLFSLGMGITLASLALGSSPLPSLWAPAVCQTPHGRVLTFIPKLSLAVPEELPRLAAQNLSLA